MDERRPCRCREICRNLVELPSASFIKLPKLAIFFGGHLFFGVILFFLDAKLLFSSQHRCHSLPPRVCVIVADDSADGGYSCC